MWSFDLNLDPDKKRVKTLRIQVYFQSNKSHQTSTFSERILSHPRLFIIYWTPKLLSTWLNNMTLWSKNESARITILDPTVRTDSNRHCVYRRTSNKGRRCHPIRYEYINLLLMWCSLPPGTSGDRTKLSYIDDVTLSPSTGHSLCVSLTCCCEWMRPFQMVRTPLV